MKRILYVVAASAIVSVAAGVLFSLAQRGEENPNSLNISVVGAGAFGVGLSVLLYRSELFRDSRLSLRHARTLPSDSPHALDFSRAVVGVGEPGSAFSFVSFWKVEDGTIAAVYLRPYWPYFPLKTDEGWESVSEALSNGIGTQVRLLAQGDYADALCEKRFSATP